MAVTINPNYGAPNANHDFASTDEDNYITVDVLPNELDHYGDVILIDNVTALAYGNGSIVSISIVYTPGFGVNAFEEGQELTDTFQYTVSDWSKDHVATVTVTVVGINDTPILSDEVCNNYLNLWNTHYLLETRMLTIPSLLLKRANIWQGNSVWTAALYTLQCLTFPALIASSI